MTLSVKEKFIFFNFRLKRLTVMIGTSLRCHSAVCMCSPETGLHPFFSAGSLPCPLCEVQPPSLWELLLCLYTPALTDEIHGATTEAVFLWAL